MIDSKYTEAVDKIMTSISERISRDGLEITHEEILSDIGKTKMELANDFKIGVDNGYSLEFQMAMLESIIGLLPN